MPRIAALALPPFLASLSLACPQAAVTDTRPAFKPLRSDENWSKFVPPEGGDWIDQIKNIKLDDDVSLSLGGELRLRAEGWSNFNFSPSNDDVFVLGRALLHMDLRVGDAFRVFAQGKAALLLDERDLPGGSRTVDVDYPELQQGFADVVIPVGLGPGEAVTLRAGRQELLFGRQRLVSPLPWSNSQRAWDAARAIVNIGGWRVDGFFSRYAAIDKYEFNDWEPGPDFWGVYSTGKLGEAATAPSIDLYYLGIGGSTGSFNGTTGDETRHTLGARLFGKIGGSGFSYDVEGAYQLGEVGVADVSAAMFGGELAYSFDQTAWSPKAWVGFDFATGDGTAGDDTVGTFNQLFPLGHAFLGAQDYIGRQNIISPSLGVSVKPLEKLTLSAELFGFWRADTSDAVYNAGGGVLRAGNLSDAGAIGSELDLIATYAINARLVAQGGYAHFFAGRFLDESGPGDDSDWVYLQLTFKF